MPTFCETLSEELVRSRQTIHLRSVYVLACKPILVWILIIRWKKSAQAIMLMSFWLIYLCKPH